MMEIFKDYMRMVNEYEVLSKEELEKLFIELENGNEFAEEDIMKHNLKLVVKIVNKYKTFGADLMDLVQEGNIGLIKAIRTFDYTLGNSFSTHAYFHINGMILDYFYYRHDMIKIGDKKSQLFFKYIKEKNKMENDLGREVEITEVAKKMGVTVEKIVAVIDAKKEFINPYSVSSEGEEYNIIEELYFDEDNLEENVINRLDEEERMNLIKGLLTADELKLIKMRFGFYDDVIYTLKEVGNELGISNEAVRVRQNKILNKLNEKLNISEKELINFKRKLKVA